MTKIDVPALENASRQPPIAGPTKLPTLSIVLRVTLAAVSSSGVARELREERRLGREERGAEDRGDAGERVDEPLRPAGEGDRAGGADRGGAAEVRWRP